MQPCLDTLLRSFRLLSAHTWTKEWNDEEKDQPGSPAGHKGAALGRLVLPLPMLLKEAADYTRTLEMEGGRHDCLSSVATAHDQCRLHGRRRPRGHPSAMAGWRGRTGP